MSAGLFLVLALDVSLAANGLAVRNLRRFQNHFGVVPLLHLGDHHFDVLLARARDQELLGLRIAEEAQHGIFFHELVDAGAQLVLVSAALGFDGKGDGRLRQLHPRILNRRGLVAQGVAGQRVLQFCHRADVAGVQLASPARQSCPA